MPYDRAHIVLQWGGTLPGGEIWTNSLRGGGSSLGPPGANFPSHADIAGWLAGHVKDALAAFHGRATSAINSVCKLTWAKMNAVGMDGKYLDPTTNLYTYPTPISGGGSGWQVPNQVCWVASLTTGLERGLAHRGRIFLPMPAVTLDSTTGQVGTAVASGLAGSVRTMIETIADTPGLDEGKEYRILVMSNRGVAGASNLVTGVAVGRVLDTQRRRRTKQVENYQTVPVDQGTA